MRIQLFRIGAMCGYHEHRIVTSCDSISCTYFPVYPFQVFRPNTSHMYLIWWIFFNLINLKKNHNWPNFSTQSITKDQWKNLWNYYFVCWLDSTHQSLISLYIFFIRVWKTAEAMVKKYDTSSVWMCAPIVFPTYNTQRLVWKRMTSV